MGAIRCKSGKHVYGSSQLDALAKCCNGYVPLFAPVQVYAQNGGYDPYGFWHGHLVFVEETDTEEIRRIKSLGPIEKRATVLGPWLFTEQ